MKKNKKWLIIIAIIVVAAAALFLICGLKRLNSKDNYEIGSVTTMNLQTTFTAKGNLKGVCESKLLEDDYYPVETILVSVGDVVKKGQTLAELDISELKRQYELAKSEEEYYKENFETIQALYAAGAVASKELEDAEYIYLSAVQKSKMYDIDNEGQILSPIDGTVTAINCTIGSSASAATIGMPAFIIEDRSSLVFKASVNEKDIPLVYEGQPARISMDTVGNPVIQGTVTGISPAVSVEKDTGKNIVEVEITPAESIDYDITGISGRAEFTYEKQDVLVVPVNALRGNRNDTRVYKLLDDGSVITVPVTTGISNDEYVEITSGELKDGDQLIMNPEN